MTWNPRSFATSLAVMLAWATVHSVTVACHTDEVSRSAVFGAVPDDGLDDRAALQAALNATPCVVELDGGVYHVVTPPNRPSNFADILTVRGGCVLRGKGPSTRIVFSGDAGHRDFFGLSVPKFNHNVLIENMFLDTALLVNTEEQTHAINVRGSQGVTIRNVWFYHPSRGGVGNRLPEFTATAIDDVLTGVAHGFQTGRGPFQIKPPVDGSLPEGLLPTTNYWVINLDADHFKLALSASEANAGAGVDLLTDGAGSGVPMGGGDCIKMIAYDNADPYPDELGAMIVEGNHFLTCDRSAFSTVGGSTGIAFNNNISYNTGDQDFDHEGNNPSRNIEISGNVFLQGPLSNGTFSIAISSPRVERLVMTGNVVDGRGVFIYSAKQSTFVGNTVICRKGGDKCFDFLKANDDVTFVGNVIVRTALTQPAPALSVTKHSTGLPGTFVMSGNVIRNETTWPTVALLGARRFTATGNTFEWRPATPPGSGTTTLLATSGQGQHVENFQVTGNEFVGPSTTAIQVTGSTFGVGRVTFVGNVARGPLRGYSCTQVATAPVAIMSAANHWAAPTTNSCTVTAGN